MKEAINVIIDILNKIHVYIIKLYIYNLHRIDTQRLNFYNFYSLLFFRFINIIGY